MRQTNVIHSSLYLFIRTIFLFCKSLTDYGGDVRTNVYTSSFRVPAISSEF